MILKTIICSLQDIASQNIKNSLFDINRWKKLDSTVFNSVYESENFRIIETDERLIYLDKIDKKLLENGYKTDLLIFASRHKSKDNRPILTVHFTGNLNHADFGGNKYELVKTAPYVLKSFLKSLSVLAKDKNYFVSLEATHHGPSDIDIPCVFIEIGSNETQWRDKTAGDIIAQTILNMENKKCPVALGFGGTHYAPRQTKIVLETDISFGHIFPSYSLEELNENIIVKAFEKSDADFVYFDHKSIKGNIRRNLEKLIKKLGYEILSESDIRNYDIRNKIKELYDLSDDTKIINKIKKEINKPLKIKYVNQELLSEAEKRNKKELEKFLSNFEIIYLIAKDGRILNAIISFNDLYLENIAQKLTDKCINIIKESNVVNIEKDKVVIIEKKFSPKLAISFGIKKGPLFGKLSKGEKVVINGKTIYPEMVYKINKKTIKLV